MNSEPKPPTFSPKHRAEQISFKIRHIMADVKRHELEIKRLQDSPHHGGCEAS